MELEEIVIEKQEIPSLQMLCLKSFLKGRTLSTKEMAALENTSQLTLGKDIVSILQAYRPLRMETLNNQLSIFERMGDQHKIHEALNFVASKPIPRKECLSLFFCGCFPQQPAISEYTEYIETRRHMLASKYQLSIDPYTRNAEKKYVRNRDCLTSYSSFQSACCFTCVITAAVFISVMLS